MFRSPQPARSTLSRSSRTPASPNPFFSHSFALFSSVPIPFIPFDLPSLCFQLLTHSFPKTPGRGYALALSGSRIPAPCSTNHSRRFFTPFRHYPLTSLFPSISFLFTFFADPSLYLLSFHILPKNTGEGGYSSRLREPQNTRHGSPSARRILTSSRHRLFPSSVRPTLPVSCCPAHHANPSFTHLRHSATVPPHRARTRTPSRLASPVLAATVTADSCP